MPVLAPIFEIAGMSTVLVTNIPFWSERVGAPRSFWPEPLEQAHRRSHPEVPAPIAAQMGRYIGKFLMGMRRGNREPDSGSRAIPIYNR